MRESTANLAALRFFPNEQYYGSCQIDCQRRAAGENGVEQLQMLGEHHPGETKGPDDADPAKQRGSGGPQSRHCGD